MIDVEYMIIHGELNIKRKEMDGFQKGDAIWGKKATPEIISKHRSLAEAKKKLHSLECSYSNCGVRGLDIEEYALIICKRNENGIYFDKTNYELAKERMPDDGGCIHVCEKFILDGEFKTVDEINTAIREQKHISMNWFDSWSNLEDWVEYRDGKTIILEEYRLH